METDDEFVFGGQATSFSRTFEFHRVDEENPPLSQVRVDKLFSAIGADGVVKVLLYASLLHSVSHIYMCIRYIALLLPH